MPKDTQIIDLLIRDINRTDPRLAQSLQLLNDKLESLDIQLNPLVIQSIRDVAIEVAVVPPPTFTFAFTNTTVRFSWSAVVGAVQYEIRKGTVWETASFQLRSVSQQADIDPLLVGTHDYLIKSITSSGTYSVTSTPLTVTVPAITTPVITVTVIDNNVLLYWTSPISVFSIKHYKIIRNGVLIGTQFGSFFTYFETVAGTYQYQIIAVDIAGNLSSAATINVVVDTPPDFQLQDVRTSSLTGTTVNMWLRGGVSVNNFIYGPWISTTWRQHFVNNGWTKIRDQINAGYPFYLQPSTGVGTYTEVFDFGVLLTNVIATAVWNFVQTNIGNTVAITVEMATSPDNINYSAYTAGTVQFFTSFRYLKLKFTFTRANAFALVKFFGLMVRLDVKREQDGGLKNCLATDVNGTEIFFNKAFRDIDTISGSATGTAYSIVIINFVDVPNPVSFKALVFDAAGVRKTRDVLWIARGII